MKKKNKKNVKINLTIDSDLEKQFREAISKKYGFKKGNMQLAIEEAIREWIHKGQKVV
jgi:citrate lyase gamma subunit